jgi:hypothetical protein
VNERKLATAFFLVAESVSALLGGFPIPLALVALSLVALFVGYLRRSVNFTAIAGFLLYYPLSSAISPFLPGPFGYLVSALFLILTTEKLMLEHRLSSVLDFRHSVDEESRVLASELSRAHKIGLAWFAALAIATSCLSVVFSSFPQSAPAVVGAAILLMFAVRLYSRS